MKFKKEQLTQTELGQIFGVSPQVVGDWLVEIGLRNEKKRTSSYAHSEGFAETLSNGSWGYKWVWNAKKTVAALIEDGHHPISPPPGDLIDGEEDSKKCHGFLEAKTKQNVTGPSLLSNQH